MRERALAGAARARFDAQKGKLVLDWFLAANEAETSRPRHHQVGETRMKKPASEYN